MENILITGGSGMIGSRLSKLLLAKGYNIRILSRYDREIEGMEVYQWDLEKSYVDPNAFNDLHHIIHLAGADIGEKPWTESRKKEIMDSRVATAELLHKYLKGHHLKSFITASGANYYGTVTSEKIFTEEDKPAKEDFTVKVVQNWEAAADKFDSVADKVVKLRCAVVFNNEESILQRFVKPVKMGFAAPVGTGQQYVPWIHIEDLCNIYAKAVEDHNFNGIYNAVAPDHVTNEKVMKEIAHLLGKKMWLPNAPAFVIKLVFGDRAELVLKGSRLSCDKLLNTGFEFKFPKLEMALKDLLKK